MIQPFLKNPFLNTKISDSKFANVGRTHLERLKANNKNGIFNTLIDPSTIAFNAYINTIGSESSTGSDQSGKTAVNDKAFKNIKDYIDRKEGVIADKFHDKPSVLKEFFPKGKKEYSQATKTNIEALTTRFIATATKYDKELGPSIAVEAQSFLDEFKTSRTTQLQTIGKVKGLSKEGLAARKILAIQLFTNLLSLLLANINNPEIVEIYFDESIGKKIKKATVDLTPVKP